MKEFTIELTKEDILQMSNEELNALQDREIDRQIERDNINASEALRTMNLRRLERATKKEVLEAEPRTKEEIKNMSVFEGVFND